MTTSRISIPLIVVAHWAVAIGHLFLAAAVLPAPDNQVSALAIVLISVGHLIAAALSLALRARPAGILALSFFLAALGADVYEHFLHLSGNNVFMVAHGLWTGYFKASVFVLVAFEIAGLIASVRRFGGGGRNTPLEKPTNAERRTVTDHNIRSEKFLVALTPGKIATEI